MSNYAMSQKVTLYCLYNNKWYRHLLQGVYFGGGSAQNPGSLYTKNVPRAMMLIPFIVKGYLQENLYKGEEDTWTLKCGDMFFFGEVECDTPNLAQEQQTGFMITTVGANYINGPMGHFEVGGGSLNRQGGGISS